MFYKATNIIEVSQNSRKTLAEEKKLAWVLGSVKHYVHIYIVRIFLGHPTIPTISMISLTTTTSAPSATAPARARELAS